jgi:hypothetical protein
VAKLAEETPSAFVAFDLLAEGDRDLRDQPQVRRRAALEKAMRALSGSVHVTPCSRDRKVAGEWFHRFEGAGLDGVIAKHEATHVPAGQARHDQGEARPHRGLRGGGLPLAQERPDELVAPSSSASSTTAGAAASTSE